MNHFKQIIVLFIYSIGAGVFAQSEKHVLQSNIFYYPEEVSQADSYKKERCRLDVYYPTKVDSFATLIWFHGGGLTQGNKFIPDQLKNQEIAIVSVNYRLHPMVKNPTYTKDAAAATAWVMKNIKRYGGDPNRVFISGHSAGGYLAAMVSMDKALLEVHQIDANDLAGVIPLSGHAITHFTIRKEQEIVGTQPVIDQFAPLHHVRKDAPPILLITGDRNLELLGRYEENAYFYRMLKENKHPDVRLLELQGYNHQMTQPAFPLMLKFIKEKSF
ncbi:alpha/beta hydrolase fold domain-containing protein [Gangjinia marincola]|uniref:Alpha/beta hydrolase fold domain-containing protein n=1 Tax=Gangjinia marincola TaxID=578463 RepID=A0ABN1MJC5_9FLAO